MRDLCADKGKIAETPFREKTTFKPFGPVDNGEQVLYGLDYRTAAWREGEENPFHTELGYWLWDAATGEVLRAFVVPRGIVHRYRITDGPLCCLFFESAGSVRAAPESVAVTAA